MSTEETEARGVIPENNSSGVILPNDAPVLYANICGVTLTSEEAVLHFAVRSIENPATAVEVVKIYTTLGHAKRLTMALVKTIIEHEGIFGEIPINRVPLNRDDEESDPVEEIEEDGEEE